MDVNFSISIFFAGIFVILQTTLLYSAYALLEPYDLLYDNGVEAFYSSDYKNVVSYMERALSSYSELRRTKVRCRLQCKEKHPFDVSSSDLRFFDAVLHRASCLNECIDSVVGSQSMHRVSDDVIQDFHRRIPYNYLQLAYAKVSG